MQNYISNLKYINENLRAEDVVSIPVPKYNRFIIDPCHPSYADSVGVFDQGKYKYPYFPLYMGEFKIDGVEEIKLSVLRLMIRVGCENAEIKLPKELAPLTSFILENINYHRQFYPTNKDCFVYLTVRSCVYDELYYKNSQEWHVDGFQGARIDRHIIEQDIFWCNVSPTDFLLQPMFCDHLDPSRYDINDFFNRNARQECLIKTRPECVYMVTPYNIHRVSPLPFSGRRVFVRLNFSPVLIEDSTNTRNPAYDDYNFPPRRDVRDFLRMYHTDEAVDSGFIL